MNHLDSVTDELTRDLDERLIHDIHPQAWHNMVSKALRHRYTFSTQVTPPELSIPYAAEIDRLLNGGVLTSLAPPNLGHPVISSDARRDLGICILNLPLRLNGMGHRSLARHAASAYWCSLARCIAIDDDLRLHADSLSPSFEFAHESLRASLTEHGDFLSQASDLIPANPASILSPDDFYYEGFFKQNKHLQNQIGQLLEQAAHSALLNLVSSPDIPAPTIDKNDWITVFDHGSDRGSALSAPTIEPRNRFTKREFISSARSLLLQPQLPHLGNAEAQPGFGYQVESCLHDRHDSRYPLTCAARALDLHGKHARANCPPGRAGINFTHNTLKHTLYHFSTDAALSCVNEPTHQTLLGAMPRSDVGKWFPKVPSPEGTRRSCELVDEHFAMLSLPHGDERRTRQAAFDRSVADIESPAGVQLDKVISDPSHPSSRPLWVDVASVLPCAETYNRAEYELARLRAAHHRDDPTSSAIPVHLRSSPAVDDMAGFKHMKYKAVELMGRRQCEIGERLGGVPLFVPLVVSTLGQIRGLRTVSMLLSAAYARKLEALGPRDDDLTAIDLLAPFKRGLRTSLLVAVARGQAMAMLASGTLYHGPDGSGRGGAG